MHAGLGLKIIVLGGRLEDADSVRIGPRFASDFLMTSNDVLKARFSDSGDYRGFCQFVSLVVDYRARFDDFRVGRYTITAWIPRVVYRDRPDHPFRRIGALTYADFASHVDVPEQTRIARRLDYLFGNQESGVSEQADVIAMPEPVLIVSGWTE